MYLKYNSKLFIIAHIPVKKSVVRKNCQNKIALNPAQKWLIFAHIPAEKSVVRQNALKSS